MRKRRYPNGGLNEALHTLRTTVKAAAFAQIELPTSKAYPAPSLPELPADLEDLRQEIQEARSRTNRQVEQWDELGKHLKSALDAALLMISLKSEFGISKRRRTATGEYLSDDMLSTDESEKEDYNLDQSPDNDGNSAATGSDSAKSETPKAYSVSKSYSNYLSVGRQVAFKLPKSAVDEWIQCEITKVVQAGVKFEVTDPEPDDDGNPGKTYTCRLKDIMPLPLPEQTVKPLPSGTVALARYPETTAFYKAKVVSYSSKRRLYYLRFEGEEDTQKEIEVNDTLVLPINKSRR